jgi:hypothetical protein
MFACLYAPPAPVCHPLAAAGSRDALLAIAQAFVPRFEVPCDEAVLLDIRGLGRILGEPRQIGAELRRAAADRGLRAHIAIASTRTAAWLLAHARAGLTCVEPGGEAAALAPLPIALLQQTLVTAQSATPSRGDGSPRRGVSVSSRRGRGPGATEKMLAHATDYPDAVFRRWGLATLGDLAALPAPALFERLGSEGPAWQRLARGEDPAQPMTPWTEDRPFQASMALEWPIEGLEPLSFVLGRLLDPLAADLERRDRAAAVLHLRLGLVTKAVFTRSLRLPAPIRDPRVLRTLMRLDLDAHPPEAAIETVAIDVEPAPGRIVQESLLERARPAPEEITTLLARLRALMGEGRCGAPALVDSYRPGAFAQAPFSAEEAPALASAGSRKPGWERLRPCRAEGLEIRGEASAKLPGGGGAPTKRSNVAPPSGPTSNVQRPVSYSSVQCPMSGVPEPEACSPKPARLPGALRRFRRPIPVRVRVEHGAPAQVIVDRPELAGGRVERCAGPWRTSGEWWSACRSHEAPVSASRPRSSVQRPESNSVIQRPTSGGASAKRNEFNRNATSKIRSASDGCAGGGAPAKLNNVGLSWDRDEWDVALSDGTVCRMFHDRETRRWFIDAVVD